MHFRLSPFRAWFWAFHTGIWAIPCKTIKYINLLVPLLMFFIATWLFELILSSVLNFSQCTLSRCVYTLHTHTRIYIYIYLGVLYMFVWAHFALDFEPSTLKFELSHAKPQTFKYINLCSWHSAVHGYLRSFWTLLWAFPTVMWAASFTCMDLIVSYTCSFEPISSLILSFPHWNLSYSVQHNKIHKLTCTFVDFFHYYIDVWALFWAFPNVLWAAVFTYKYI